MDTSGITQPPNPALALWRLYSGSSNKRDLMPFLEKAYDGLKQYHDFLLTVRDPNREGLAAIFHPWACGIDNPDCYNGLIEATRKELAAKGYEQRIKKRKDITNVIAAHRPGERDYECYGRLIGFFVAHDFDQDAIYNKSPFVVQDVLFNSILAESISSLAEVANVLAENYKACDPEKAEHYSRERAENDSLASKVREAIMGKLYDPETGMFYNFDLRGNRLLKIPTIHSISPLFGKVAEGNQADRLIEQLTNPEMFSPREGLSVPTTPVNSPTFDNVRYWRGPVWPVTNWIIANGVENYDRDLARKLREQTVGLVAEGHDLTGLDQLAASLMEYTSFGEQFTTPSRTQYQHGWLWDSGFAAIGWRHIKEKTSPEIWEKVMSRREELLQQRVDLTAVRRKLREEFGIPLFAEYFAPTTTETDKAGSPLGSDMMTWSAALFLDLIKKKNN
jgi:hypothetical protein